jgi:valyl-tRNA synthetase
VLVNVFDKMLRLLHPFMPFVSEEIWQVIRPYIDEPNLAAHLPIAKYPEPSATNPLSPAEETAMNPLLPAEKPTSNLLSAEEKIDMNLCIEATEAWNSLRALLGWPPSQRARARYRLIDLNARLRVHYWKQYAMLLSKLSELEETPDLEFASQHWIGKEEQWGRVWLEVPPSFDLEKARLSFVKQLKEIQEHLARRYARMDDPGFWKSAPQEAKDENSAQIEELRSRKELLQRQLNQLQ